MRTVLRCAAIVVAMAAVATIPYRTAYSETTLSAPSAWAGPLEEATSDLNLPGEAEAGTLPERLERVFNFMFYLGFVVFVGGIMAAGLLFFINARMAAMYGLGVAVGGIIIILSGPIANSIYKAVGK